ncbi:hypothetical protein F5Y09DRAFT_301601 [Xylaria sp. FL1042]|nr:hypothetical protein F5Y09DRAFT_301601 [Xylaria sp. FL1042]
MYKERRQYGRETSSLTSLMPRCSAYAMSPLQYNANIRQRAVILATVPIVYGHFDLSQRFYQLLAKHMGMGLNSVSYWAICVVDRGFGPCWCYDLMSDQLSLSMLAKSYLRIYEATAELVATWTSEYWVGRRRKPTRRYKNWVRRESVQRGETAL